MNYYHFILTLFFICPKLFCVPIIQLSLIPNNQVYKNRIVEKLESKQNDPLVKPIEAGYIVTYGGFVDVSDFDGLVSFPRKQADRTIHLLVTPEATPISMFHNTLSHWKLIPSMPSRFYKIEQVQDEATKKNVWKTTEIAVPTDNIIPLDTVILFTHPDCANPLLEEKDALNNENLLIPPIEVSCGVDNEKNAIVFLKIRHFFSETSPAFNKQGHRYEISLKP
jgi:hypothetical protein